MSGPWEDFQKKPAAAVPPVAVSPTAPMAKDGPWKDFQAAPANDPPPLDVTVVGGRYPKKGEDGYNEFIARGYTPDKDGNLQPPEVSTGGAALHGLESGALAGWDDEIEGLGGGVGSWLRGRGFKSGYEAERDKARGGKDAAWSQHPLAYAAGMVPGMATSLAMPGGVADQTGNALGNLTRLAGTGALQGAIAGAGSADGSGMDRVRGAAAGAAGGALAAPLVQPLARTAGSLISRIGESTGLSQVGRNAMNSGLDVLGRRAPQDATAMADRAAELRSAGVEPSLADVMDESGRGVVRANVAKAGPAREEAARAADAVYSDAQDRVANAARAHMGNERLTSRQIANQITDERNQVMGTAMDPHRNTPVPVTPELAQTLSTPEGQRALTVARGYLQPAEREQVNAVLRASRDGTFGQTRSPQAQALVDQLPPGMGQAAKEQAIAQIEQMHPAPTPPTLTVDIADKFSRALNKKAQGNDNGLGRVASSMANTVRDAAREASPEYGQALDDYAARSRVADAAAGTGRYAEGSDFLKSPVDHFQETVSTADRTAPTVEGPPLPSEADALRLRARDAVVNKATEKPSAAYGMAKHLSTGSAQGDRNLALLGPRNAGNLRDSMSAEATRFRNTAYIDERTGSKTAGVIGDQLNNEIVNLIPNAMTGGKWHVVRAVTNILRRENVRGIDAERLTRDAISRDPQRVDAAIQYLGQRGMRHDTARSLVRSIGVTLAARGAGSAQEPTTYQPR